MNTNSGQLTPNMVAANLAALARELDQAIRAIESADRDRVERRGAYDLAYARAFLAAEGSMDIRRYVATEQTHDKRMDADVADATFRHLQRRIAAINTRVDVGRSVNSALKTEMSLAGLEETP